jgi:hypothetical protein
MISFLSLSTSSYHCSWLHEIMQHLQLIISSRNRAILANAIEYIYQRGGELQ